MKEFYHPFKIVYDGDVISSISFKDNDLVWAKNFKRAVASVLQIQGYRTGAFVEKEVNSEFLIIRLFANRILFFIYIFL